MTVDQYYAHFISLLDFIPGVTYSEQVKIEKFRAGLLFRIQTAMGSVVHTTVQVKMRDLMP